MSPLDFFDAVWRAFERAAEVSSPTRSTVMVGRRPVCLEFAGPALVPLLTPALEHIRAPNGTSDALRVGLFDSESTGVCPPAAPWGADAYLARGEIAGFNDARIRTLYQPGTDALNVFDRERIRAVYWIRRPRLVPFWETGAPLRAMLHWWLEDGDLQLIHGGAVGYRNGGILLVGRGGSGKSTSTLACLGSDLTYAGDDYVVVSTRGEPWIHSLYQTAKLDPENLARFPNLKNGVINGDRLDSEKALILPGRCYPACLSQGFPIRAIVVPRVTGKRDTRLVPGSPAEGLAALAPSTMFQLPGDAARVFSKVATLVRRVPTLTLEAGTDLPQIPAVIGRYLREH